MRIGILTFHRTLNYGAVLQCYALKEALCGLGHDVEVIDYRPNSIEKERWAFYKNSFIHKSWMQKIKYLCLIPIKSFYKRKTAHSFDIFLNSNFVFSKIVRRTSDVPSYYDVIIFGSDQIWSPILCNGFDPVYYGEFHKGKTRFISYAASLEGYKDFSTKQWKIVAERMKNFDAISVRELSFCNELSKHLEQHVECVVDPTLLVPRSLIKALVKKHSNKRYVFLFTVQKGNLAYEVAQRIARERNIIVIRLRATKRLNISHKEHRVRQIYAASPEKFIELIDGAECVVTNSFHATAISLQLGKEFYAVNCERSNRIENLLTSIELRNRFISSVNEIEEISAIEYPKVHSRLKHLSVRSMDYLVSNINKNDSI